MNDPNSIEIDINIDVLDFEINIEDKLMFEITKSLGGMSENSKGNDLLLELVKEFINLKFSMKNLA